MNSKKNKKKMIWDWTIIIAVCTSLLAITSAVLQLSKERKAKVESLEKEKVAAQKQAELQAELKENYKSMNEHANKIIGLQQENKTELGIKTDKILSLQDQLDTANKLLISQQKESLNYLTGGDELMKLYPDRWFVPTDVHSLKIVLMNQTKYPQYNIEVIITDDFKFQLFRAILEKDHTFPMASAVKKTIFKTNFEQIEPGNGRLIYETKLPIELKEGWIQIDVKSRNGKFVKIARYKQQEDHTGYWKLLNENEFYSPDQSLFLNYPTTK